MIKYVIYMLIGIGLIIGFSIVIYTLSIMLVPSFYLPLWIMLAPFVPIVVSGFLYLIKLYK